MRAKSCPPSTGIADLTAPYHSDAYVARAGAPPAKAPPPLPPSDYRFREAWLRCRRVFPVVYALNNNPVLSAAGIPMVLAIDVSHTIGDVELSVRYHLGRDVILSIASPTHVLPSDRFLMLCAVQRKAEIQIVLQEGNGTYII